MLAIAIWSGCSDSDFYQVAPISSNTVAKLDDRYGFGELRFGDPPTPDMRLVLPDPVLGDMYVHCPSCPAGTSVWDVVQECQQRVDMQHCALNEMWTTVGQAHVSAWYRFKGRRLTEVDLDAHSAADNQPLLQALRYAYGPGQRERANKSNEDRYEWWHGRLVTMTYHEPSSNGAAKVLIFSYGTQ